jgi:transposase
LGNPLRFILSPGQASDYIHAQALIKDLLADYVLGDKGYDSTAFREAIAEQGAVAVIPPRTTSPQVSCDYVLYCERNLVERFFPEDQTFQETGNTLRTDTKSLLVHAVHRQRIHLGTLNVNAL